MNLFSNTRTKRNTAFAMLLVSLFAVASGVAHACLLEGPGAHAHMPAAGSADTGHVPAVLAGHMGAHDGRDDHSDTSCPKVREAGSNAPVKLQAGFDLTAPDMAPLVVIVWNAAAPVVSGASRLVDLRQPPVVGLPFRVRYSRLTL
jgi:hypothetical protein